MKILQVLIEYDIFSNTPFSYVCADKLNVDVGFRVKVPFANQTLIGYVIHVKQTNLDIESLKKLDKIQYRFIIDVLDTEPIINKELHLLVKQMATTYITPFMTCLKTILPPSYKPTSSSLNVHKNKKLQQIIAKKDFPTDDLTEKQKILYWEILQKEKLFLKDIKQKEIVTKLIQRGAVYKQEIEVHEDYLNAYIVKENPITLNEEQRQVVKEFKNSNDCVYLLQGVTGSGKTEVYIELVKSVIQDNKNAIVLVPEISLTPMIIERFRSVFPKIAVLHGNLSPTEKNNQYNKIKNHEANVVIGARSAIFAPLENIGIIILDEEQSRSYKQDNSPTYHARDIAILRAKYHQCKVLLGSATPSFESKARAMKNVYHPLYLKKRANQQKLPQVQIVNMREDILKEGTTLLSKTLDCAIRENIKNKQKMILLHNRRGYAPYVYCRQCGYSFKCPTCEVSMAYHKAENKFKCHYCNHEVHFAKICPKCNGKEFLYIGNGTQKIEEILAEEYPEAKILRMDNDTTHKKHGHLKILQQFSQEDYNILLGTQMVAKGLNFKEVTLVGVIDGDITLNVADFRSGEFTFELLSQVAGRAGRGELTGKVIIQTFNPEHYAIVNAAKHDYEQFFKQDMIFRHRRNYPPFSYLCAITVLAKKPENAILLADKIFAFLENFREFELLGPALPYIYKEKEKYKVRLIAKHKNKEFMIQQFNHVNEKFKKESKELKATILFDIDAYQLL